MAKRDMVLFVSHDAFRGGATLMLLSFLRWLKKNSAIRFHVLLCQRGELENEFEQLAPVWYLDKQVGRKAALRAAARRLLGSGRARNVVRFGDAAARIGSAASFGLIYSNTSVNGPVLEALAPMGCPVLTHVHELENTIHNSAGADFERVKRCTDHFVAVSDATRKNLVTGHGIPSEKVECIRGFIPTVNRPRADRQTLKRALAEEIGIPEHSRIVGTCGVVYWLKGSDLFLQLALALRARAPLMPVHLVWVGAKPHGEGFYSFSFQHDLEQAGLASCVHFIGSRPNPLDYIASFDVHSLVSREESLSLVMLEAATVEVPTVCFDGAGGPAEFVQDDAGSVVPYLDVSAMAESVLNLLESEDLRSRLGRRAHEKARAWHDIEVAAPKLLGTIERMLASEKDP
jgi:glycosyltransferase involved in cell wall biosynthesis